MRNTLKTAIIASAIGLLSSFAAQASTSYTFLDTGRATATITVDLNQITITLTDLVVNPNGVADNLSAIWFSTSNTPTNASISSGSSQSVDVASTGAYTLGSTVAPGWGLTLNGAVTKLDDIGFAGPANTIIGSPNASTNTYSTGGGSISGNGPHNPFLYKMATWTLSETGVNAATVISNLRFQFGTSDNAGEAGTLITTTTPEPGTYALLLGGLGLVFFGRRRYGQQAR